MIKRRFAGIRPSNHRNAQRLGVVIRIDDFFLVFGGNELFLVPVFRFVLFRREGALAANCIHEKIEEVAKAGAVFGRQWHGIAKAKFEGFVVTGLAGLAFIFVGDKDHRLLRAPGNIGEKPVRWRQAGPRIDEE